MHRVTELMVRLARICYSRPGWSLSVGLALAGLSLGLAWFRLYFDTDWISLFPKDDPYRIRIERLHQELPTTNDMMVLVEGGEPSEREAVLDELARRLESEPQYFRDVFHRLDLRPYRRGGFYFLELTQLRRIEQVLRGLQPLWGGLHDQEGMPALLRAVPKGLRQEDPARVQVVLDLVTRTMQQLLACFDDRSNFEYHSPWDELIPAPTDPRYQDLMRSQANYFYNTLAGGRIHFLLVLPPPSKITYSPNEPTVDRARAILAELGARYPKLELTVTGAPVLATDERRTCNTDAVQAALISLCLVLLLFVFGFRELGRPALVLITLAVGICWTAGYTTLVVGHLNFLTITFLSMLTGLGADFGIHILARYAEERERGVDPLAAVEKTMRRTGQVTWVGAVVTSAGFWTLTFSQFQAVAELGIIAGGGVLLCFLALTTVLWSMLALMETRRRGSRFHPPLGRELVFLEGLILDYPRPVLTAFALITLVSLTTFGRISFDYNLLDLQDPHLESIRTEIDLSRTGNSVVLYGVSLTRDLAEARRRVAEFQALPSVSRVESVVPLLPAEVDKKRPLVRRLVGLARQIPELRLTPIRGVEGLLKLQRAVEQAYDEFAELVPDLTRSRDERVREGAQELQRLWLMLEETALRIGPGVVETAVEVFQQESEADMKFRLALLRAQEDDPPTLEDVPPALLRRTVGTSGSYVIRIFPRENVWNKPAMDRFVSELRSVDPEINGEPVLVWHSNHVIHATYKTVGWYTYAVVFLLLWVYFRSAFKALLTVLPISLSLVWMVALMVVWNIPFNPANFIALPMLVGIGASFGIQVVARAFEEGKETMLSFSTGPAVIFSAGMAMSGFGSLLWSAHVGVKSLGFIVTAAVGANLVCSLVFLPALIRALRTRL